MLKLMLVLMSASAALASPESKSCENPWSIMMWIREAIDRYNYQCSGALIQPDVVFTAAHCFSGKNVSSSFFRARGWDLEGHALKSVQYNRVQNHVVHDKFNHSTGVNDYALLFLSKPINVNDMVAAVCLPEANDNFIESTCFEYEWRKEYLYSIPMNSKRRVLENKACPESLRTLQGVQKSVLGEDFICTDRNSTAFSAPQLKAETPLLCQIRNSDPARYVLAGISTSGQYDENGLTVFANVAKARTWIDEQLHKRAIP